MRVKLEESIVAALALLASVCAGAIPLPEHPRPDWCRSEWVNLNGEWRFEFDAKNAGVREKWFSAADSRFGRTIVVPFPWGSPLSGVKDEADVGWYRRDIVVPAAWKGRRVFLVVGASDHDTTAWLGGRRLGAHSGGYTPFEFELTGLVKWGQAQKLTLRAWDPPAAMSGHYFGSGRRSEGDWHLFGKQGYGNARGVWQTVYLEARGGQFLDTVHFTPDIDDGSVTAEATLGAPAGTPLELEIRFRKSDRAEPARIAFAPGDMAAKAKIPLDDVKLWDLDNPYLYEVECALGEKSAPAQDVVRTYFGMRKIATGKLPGSGHPYVTLNNKPIYLQLTLDQSYNPGGFYTFPSDEFMKNEILISKKLGLSGNRVHIKVEVPRKLYWADRLGLLIMADMPNAWGPVSEEMFRTHRLCTEETIRRDYNHPSVFAWVLFNETWGLLKPAADVGGNSFAARYSPDTRREVARAYARAKRLDPTRLVEDNSVCKFDHVATDINTWHDYLAGYKWEACVESWCKNTFPGSRHNFADGFAQRGQPMFNTECGNAFAYGACGDVDWSWDYHTMANAFRRRLKCCGWLYTEHHDVINEFLGYVKYDRSSRYTGIEELTGGRMSLKDFHADAFLPLDVELCREFKAGETWTMPVDISLTTGKYAGRKMSLAATLIYFDAAGRRREIDLPYSQSFTAEAWQNGRIADVPVKLPDETACGVVLFSLFTGEGADRKAVGRNFACFVTRGAKQNGVVSVVPSAFSKAEWSEKKWDVLDGLKVCGAGKGFFEYEFTGVPAGRGCVFRAEVSSKRLNAKDFTGEALKAASRKHGDKYVRGDRAPSSYPMTSDDKWPGEVKVIVNGVLVKTVALPDDPGDHRGILSWFSQPRNGRLFEAGSYGYLVEAEIPSEVVAKGGGTMTVRLEAEKGGLAIYGACFGRYPLDPSVWLQ